MGAVKRPQQPRTRGQKTNARIYPERRAAASLGYVGCVGWQNRRRCRRGFPFAEKCANGDASIGASAAAAAANANATATAKTVQVSAAVRAVRSLMAVRVRSVFECAIYAPGEKMGTTAPHRRRRRRM